jgi:hypothetical protein
MATAWWKNGFGLNAQKPSGRTDDTDDELTRVALKRAPTLF